MALNQYLRSNTKVLALYCVISLIVCNTACAFSRGRVAIDSITHSTILDGDATGLVEGCGNQPQVGFTYCRVQEGQTAGQQIWFIGPPAVCDQKEGCVFLKVWNNQSQLVWGGSIEKGKTRVGVSWNTLLSSPTFEVSHRGFWTWNMEVFWKGPDGRERTSKSQGDIVLRTYRTGYLPLQEVSSDPAYVWDWVEGSCHYRMTSGLRAYIKCGNSY